MRNRIFVTWLSSPEHLSRGCGWGEGWRWYQEKGGNQTIEPGKEVVSVAEGAVDTVSYQDVTS